MLNPASDCSRRTFLNIALTGAGTLLVGGAHFVGPAAASLFTLMGDTAPADVTTLSIHEVAALVKQGRISPVEITRACLARIDALNPLLNAFITVTEETALAEAAGPSPRYKEAGGAAPCMAFL
jgi:hypothetical protein